MVAIRLALDDWVASGGRADLPSLIDLNLCSLSIEATDLSTSVGTMAKTS
jgi:hypothetical protein